MLETIDDLAQFETQIEQRVKIEFDNILNQLNDCIDRYKGCENNILCNSTKPTEVCWNRFVNNVALINKGTICLDKHKMNNALITAKQNAILAHNELIEILKNNLPIEDISLKLVGTYVFKSGLLIVQQQGLILKKFRIQQTVVLNKFGNLVTAFRHREVHQ